MTMISRRLLKFSGFFLTRFLYSGEGSSLDYLASPIHSFTFNGGSLDDAVGEGVLLAEGGGAIKGSEYVFGKNEGPTLVSPMLTNNGEYTIEMSITLQDPMTDGDGTIKLLDFKDLDSDHGAYAKDGLLGYIYEGGLVSQPASSTPPPPTIKAGVPAHVVVTRRFDTRMVTFYVDGVKVLSMSDMNEDFVIGTGESLRFFQDDNDEFCENARKEPRCDSGAGSIDYVKIYDLPLTSDDVVFLFIQGEEKPAVIACQCNLEGECIDKLLSKYQVLDVCVKSNRDDFIVVSVDDLEYEQNGVIDVAVERGVERITSVIIPYKWGTVISTILPERFFYDDNLSPIAGAGTVSLAVAEVPPEDEGGRSLRRRQRGDAKSNQEGRRLFGQIKVTSNFEVVFKTVEPPDDDFFAPHLDEDPKNKKPPSPEPPERAPINNSTEGLLDRVEEGDETTSQTLNMKVIVNVVLAAICLAVTCVVGWCCRKCISGISGMCCCFRVQAKISKSAN